MPGLAPPGRAPWPSRRTRSRRGRHPPKEVQERGASASLVVCLASQACSYGKRGPRLTGAAPHPRLHLTGARVTVPPLCDEDGTRTPRGCSGAENSRLDCCHRHGQGAGTSRRVWCRHAGAPAWDIPSAHVADGQRCWHPPGGKKATKPRRGSLCPLTTGGLISVRPVLGFDHRVGHLRPPTVIVVAP